MRENETNTSERCRSPNWVHWIRAHTVTATLWLLLATGVGILMAFKFGAPEFGSGAWLTFGRLRPIHTNATFYGFASIALVGLAYYVVARSSGAKLYSATLAWNAFSTDDPFDPRRAEARSSIPVWVWVMSLFVVAWAVWYAARMWDVPTSYAKTPTYRDEAASETPPGK